ncbi:DUF4132 domain-containing protein [Kribbella sp. NPDC049174]|uniref:DUF4132 domain-containing protein n=1 Tax=Kribbella sp. NPDC049174 TaxID=3364112 RepID=UPI0037170BCC
MTETTAVPAELEQVLRAALESLADRNAALPERVADYVLTGAPESALAGLGDPDDALKLALLHPHYERTAATRALPAVVRGWPRLPLEVLGRWARVLGACMAGGLQWVQLDRVGGRLWPEALILQLGNVFTDQYNTMSLPLHALDHARFEELLVADGLEPSALLTMAFTIGRTTSIGYVSDCRRELIQKLAGYDDAVHRHTEAIRAAISVDKVADQQSVLAMLLPLTAETLTGFAPEIARILTSSSQQVRKDARPLLAGPGVMAELRQLAASGKPEQRLHALKLLWASDSPELRSWAEECAAADRAASVRDLLKDWNTATVADELPPLDLPVVDLRVPLTDDIRERLQSIVAQQIPGHMVSQARRFGLRTGLSDDDLQAVLETLETGQPVGVVAPDDGVSEYWAHWTLSRHAAALGPVVTTVLLARCGTLVNRLGEMPGDVARIFDELFKDTGHPTLLELAVLLETLGVDGRAVIADRFKRTYGGLGDDWPEEAVAPFVQYALPQFLELLTTASSDWYTDDKAPFRALAMLPALPQDAVDALFGVALGPRKTSRRDAQDILVRAKGVEDRIVAALTDGKADTRTNAAQWLQRLRYESAVPALEAAVAKEKNDVTKGALLDALQAYGLPVEKYVDRAGLAKQAETALAKGLPKGLEWLHWEGLPPVHWADSGEAVQLPILRFLIAQSVRAKSPEPNALLRKYCGLFVSSEREELGQHLLEAWLAHDTTPIPMDEALKLAEQQAAWLHPYMNSNPQYYQGDPMLGMSEQEIVARLLPGFARQPAGSATASKGLLAVVAACAGERAAAPVGRYLKEWYGTRAAQGKALIAMLAWIDHPSATQLMLSVGSRFRTKSFQEEATRQAEALAERKGWTLSELADRTIPVAGFDPDGHIELSYGDRVFTAVLRPDLTIELRSPEDKRIKALPAPRQSDDEAAVKDAKKALTAAKRELKAVVQLQTERLYEALCTERTWPADDWERYLNGHPIVRYLTQRLAWVADGEVVFRPLDDGTLTDVDDSPVKLADDTEIAIAHDSLLDEETVRSWQQHLDDYEVVPLFQQFGKGTFGLPPDRADDNWLRDFEGHLLEAFALRGRAGKLGYTRGGTEDGGWFYEYEKRFPTLGLTIVVSFTGNPLPEQNRTVALRAVGFRQSRPGESGAVTMLRLADVPAVLLSEAYNDLRLMASDGSGYDPDWEKKSEY